MSLFLDVKIFWILPVFFQASTTSRAPQPTAKVLTVLALPVIAAPDLNGVLDAIKMAGFVIFG